MKNSLECLSDKFYLRVKCKHREVRLRAGARRDMVGLAWVLGLDFSEL